MNSMNHNPTIIGLSQRAILAMAAVAAMASSAHALPLVTFAETANISVTGVLDLEDNGLVLRDGATPGRYAIYQGYITTGLYNGVNGYWDGPGINSSTAAAGSVTGLGILNNADASYSQFLGSSVLGTDILIRYTYFGDIDLNGVVDAVDFSLIASGFGTSGGGWLSGDLDYNGTVDAVDFSLIGPSFGLALLPGGPTGFSDGGGKPGGALVPEPSSFGLLLLGIVSLVSRRGNRVVKGA